MQIETERKVRMEINIEKLKETVILRNTTLEALAYEMGINRSTLYRKLRRGPAATALNTRTTAAPADVICQKEKNIISSKEKSSARIAPKAPVAKRASFAEGPPLMGYATEI